MNTKELEKDIEEIAQCYQFKEVETGHTYEEYMEEWGKDVYECTDVEYVYDEKLENEIIQDLIDANQHTEREIEYIKENMNEYFIETEDTQIRLVKEVA